MKKSILLLMLFFMCFTVISAKGFRGGQKGQKKDFTDMFTKLKKELNLTDEQQTKFDEIVKKYKTKFDALRPDKNSETKPDKADFEAMRTKMDELRENMNKEIKAILTDEQVEIFEKYQKIMQQKRPGGQGGPGNGQGSGQNGQGNSEK